MKTKLNIAIAVIALTLTACDNDVSKAINAVNEMQKSDFNDVMEKADKDNYEPPADGKLSAEQIQMYIAVRKREGELLKTNADRVKQKTKQADKVDDESMLGMLKGLEALQEMANFASLDIRAAMELKYNTAEYQWVKDTLLDTSAAMMMSEAQNRMGPETLKMLEQEKSNIQQQRASVSDPEMQKVFDVQIKAIDDQINETEALLEQSELTEGMRHNQALIKKHQHEIDIINTEMKKWQLLENAG